jgi:hypothetical protein
MVLSWSDEVSKKQKLTIVAQRYRSGDREKKPWSPGSSLLPPDGSSNQDEHLQKRE